MLQTMRKHLTYSNVAATLALLFAITGGAFAATGGGSGNPSAKATASVSPATGRSEVSDRVIAVAAKKKPKPKSTRGPAGPAGKNGANGTNGTNGATGAPGEKGAAGANGSNGGEGKAGTSVTSEAAGSECKAGGTKFTSASGTSHVCNGENGTTGFTETLPKGKTETGAWSIEYASNNMIQFTTISFPIPLAADKKCQGASGEYEDALCGAEVHYVNREGTEEAAYNATTEKFEAKATSACPGTIAAPAAEPGNLCIYQGPGMEGANEIELGLTAAFISSPTLPAVYAKYVPGAGLSGTILQLESDHSTIPLAGWGTWAVSAAE